jgi:transposase InsO family protein
MAQHRHKFPILKMSKVFGVSASGYYRWLNRPASARARQNRSLKQAIRSVWGASRCMYGAPRIHQVLLEQGMKTSLPRVARLMANMGIASQIRKKWVRTTHSDPSYPMAPNRLNRRFNPSQISQVWVSDITYLPSQQGWLYLTIVMDLADRQIIGWALSEQLSAKQTSLAAFEQAVARRTPAANMLFHSDRGVQYACGEFTDALKAKSIEQSMSRKGNCWDNAPAESFFKTLKSELNMAVPFEHYQQARANLFEFIEIWYNRKRLHSALNYQTPVQAQQQLNHQHAA